ncbi:hypothetical protein HBH52_089540 [Parastagonospora nodorum]|nr:hypothetical protein HBH52_089540 [Parastagonospora nodorum]
MRFPTILGALAAVGSVIAAPLVSAPSSLRIAGEVITNKGVHYSMTDLNEIKAFDNQIDNGRYPYPVDYNVESGFHCIFYREATRGVGSPIGEYYGPVTGKFEEWIAFYKCFVVNGKEVAARAPEDDDEMIPCGQVTTAAGDTHDLNETTKNAGQHAEFTVNGERYEPWPFHVTDTCTCNFFRLVYPGYPHLLLPPAFGGDKSLQGYPALMIRSRYTDALAASMIAASRLESSEGPLTRHSLPRMRVATCAGSMSYHRCSQVARCWGGFRSKKAGRRYGRDMMKQK